MNLIRAAHAIETCKAHLESLTSPDPQIEAILTAYASSIIYACFEQEVRDIVSERAHASKSNKSEIRFGEIAATRLVRSIKISELSGLAANFDSECKTAFRDILEAEDSHAWDTIINNRHEVAHQGTDSSTISNLTFAELEAIYPRARKVLSAFQRALFE